MKKVANLTLLNSSVIDAKAFDDDDEQRLNPSNQHSGAGATVLHNGSTITLVDEDLAHQIGVEGPVEPLNIEAISQTKLKSLSRKVEVQLRRADHSATITARTFKNLKLSSQRVSQEEINSCSHLRDIAEELLYHVATPRVLIGQDNWHLLVSTETRKGQKEQPVASLTHLGWVLHGVSTRTLGAKTVNHLTVKDDIDEQLKQFFAIESLMIIPKKPTNDPEQRAQKILEDSTVQREDGRYEVGLLWKTEKTEMPVNRDNAYKRLLGIEKKLDKNEELKKKYEEQMEDLVTKGYAEPAPTEGKRGKTWYLPHFAVFNPMKPEKIRLVHDAAAKTKGVSLNDHLLTGPDLLQSLPGVLMKFRQHRYAVTSDIKEMFMQVKIKEEDRDALRYLWRRGEDRQQPPVEYRMTSLIFGATCSPATAIFVKNVNAKKYEDMYPEASAAVVNNHYVDDYLQSFATEDEAIKTAKAVKYIQQQAHYELTQWNSNSQKILEELEVPINKKQTVGLDCDQQAERVLGLEWHPKEDCLRFNLNLARLPANIFEKKPTKRIILKVVMSLFDPLGFASPVTTRAKQLLQELWRRGSEWDQEIDEDLNTVWQEWVTNLAALSSLKIPRSHPKYSDADKIELHTFVDASEAAYSTAIYWRVTTPAGDVSVSLVVAKARVAPLKLTSIPRLELQAAVMGARIASSVIEEHDRKPSSKTYWTDSKTVLAWLRNGSRAYRPFVAHRVAAIEDHSKIDEWRWVPTKLNVADDATREVPTDFNINHRWFQGPDFLREDESQWPVDLTTEAIQTGEEKTHTIQRVKSEFLPSPSRFSRWERLLRATARLLQFVKIISAKKEKCHYKRTKKTAEKDPTWTKTKKNSPKPLLKENVKREESKQYMKITAELLEEAEMAIFKSSQEDSFKEEKMDIYAGRKVDKKSRLKDLSTQIVDGKICLQSRISNTEGISTQQKTPMILDGKHRAVKLYIDHIHRRLHHTGVEAVVNELRTKYFIIGLRPTVKTIVRGCLFCRIKKGKPSTPPTGSHPPARLAHHKRPFSFTGVDYFGPLTIKVARSTQKRYVALFTCLTTRAVHLEVAASLTTSSAVMALRRMIARRGCPSEIYSDNGTNLQGADKELRQAMEEATIEEASKRHIKWRFIPPGAPFMGGAWERLVKSVKIALGATMMERHPTEEVLTTLLAEVEFTVNNRPLTHVSVDTNDPEALTPNHFLLGGPAFHPTPGVFDEKDLITMAHWRAAQRLADIFWNRWVREYLPDLQHRREPHGHGQGARMGDIVLIADGNLPRNVWPRGKIVRVFPGADGVIRAVDVLTKGGVMRRPVKKLVILPTTVLPAEDNAVTTSVDTRREHVQDQ